MSNDENDDYEVGYRMPPVRTQFQKGKSGNPNGRPKKKDISIYDAIMDEMSGLINVNIGGQMQSITRLDAMIKAVGMKAMKGDIKAAQFLMPYFQHHDMQLNVPEMIVMPPAFCVHPDCPSHKGISAEPPIFGED